MKLKDGRDIDVKPFTVGQLPALTKAAAKAAKDVDWRGLDSLTMKEAGLKLFEIAPETMLPFIAIASGLDEKEVAALPIADGLKIVNAILDANDTDQLVEVFKDFFARIAEKAQPFLAGNAIPTPTKV